MSYAIIAYLKKGDVLFYPLSEDFSREEAIAATVRWDEQERGGYLPKNIKLLKLIEVDVIDWMKDMKNDG